MTANRIIIMSTIALTLVGAGCAATSGDGYVAIPSSQANGEAMIGGQGTDLRAAAELKREVEAAASVQAVAKADAPTDDAAPAADDGKAWERPTKPVGLLPSAEVSGKIVRLMTSKGEIVFELLPEEGPLATSNFVALAHSKYYDGLKFHRYVAGFVIQGGDPKGDGTGGPGYTIAEDPVSMDYDAGIVAMAKTSAPHSTGSQFFIMVADAPTLPKEYSIFGRVISGMDAVRNLREGDVMTAVTVEDKE